MQVAAYVADVRGGNHHVYLGRVFDIFGGDCLAVELDAKLLGSVHCCDGRTIAEDSVVNISLVD